VVGFPPFRERYTSTVLVEPHSRISALVREGKLLKQLSTTWTFAPGPGPAFSCWLSFEVEFQFQSRLHSALAEVFMREAVWKMRAAFEARTREKMALSEKEKEKKRTLATGL